jgi:hypothetical protein
MLHQIDHEDPAHYAGQVPEPFASILQQALATDPSNRWITMAQIADWIVVVLQRVATDKVQVRVV